MAVVVEREHPVESRRGYVGSIAVVFSGWWCNVLVVLYLLKIERIFVCEGVLCVVVCERSRICPQLTLALTVTLENREGCNSYWANGKYKYI